MTLALYNTLTRKKEPFEPIDAANVRMYVCGPTVYGRAHLGNARSVVVYDVLFRLLQHIYGPEHVTYARNITDVDDKINAAAKERGIPIGTLTTEVTGWFHDDMAALNVLPASDSKSNGIMIEPRATDHIAQMIQMIERLIKNGNAYAAQGNVMFAVKTLPEYGRLSHRVQEDLEAGARVKVEGYKRDPNDFVLWKPAGAGDDPSSVFDSPWGPGRPGWHIECSAMSTHYLGQDFDIHGGGSDLMFPHHENEIAQSIGAHPGSLFAKYWVHNGFLTVNGEKMSKSLGNFFTVRDLLEKNFQGAAIRFTLLRTNYGKPLDWTTSNLQISQKLLDTIISSLFGDFLLEVTPKIVYSPNTPFLKIKDEVEVLLKNNHKELINWVKAKNFHASAYKTLLEKAEFEKIVKSLLDDLNLSTAIAKILDLSGIIHHKSLKISEVLAINEANSSITDLYALKRALLRGLDILGIDLYAYYIFAEDLNSKEHLRAKLAHQNIDIDTIINNRITAKKAKNWAEADRIRDELKAQGILLEDRPDGTTDWRRE